MEKANIVESINHIVNINDRKNITVSGVKKLNSFDESEFFVETVMGPMIIKGETLELLKLDTFQGSLSIKGKVNAINYLESGKKVKTETVLARLFK